VSVSLLSLAAVDADVDSIPRLCLPILVEIPLSDPVPPDLPPEEWPWVEEVTELSYKDGEGTHPQFSAIVSINCPSSRRQSIRTAT